MPPLDLSLFFKTKAQADDFTQRIDIIIQSIFSSNFNLENAIAQQFGQVEKDKFLKFLRAQNIPMDNPTQLKQFLEKLKEVIAILPTLDITLAFVPRENTFKSISDWFMLNLRMQVLINIKIDTSLIAGAHIDFKGRHFENSIQTKVTTALTEIFNAPPIPSKNVPVSPAVGQQS